MRVLFALLLLPVLLGIGCQEKVDTKHREEQGFVDTRKDPTAIMPKGMGDAPPGAPAKK